MAVSTEACVATDEQMASSNTELKTHSSFTHTHTRARARNNRQNCGSVHFNLQESICLVTDWQIGNVAPQSY
jgi:hypothetical protein